MSHPPRSHPLDNALLINKIDGIDNQLHALRQQHNLISDLASEARPKPPVLYISVQSEALAWTSQHTADQIEAIQSQLSEVRQAVCKPVE